MKVYKNLMKRSSRKQKQKNKGIKNYTVIFNSYYFNTKMKLGSLKDKIKLKSYKSKYTI